MLKARPGFTAVAVITLALGIGANTAIFSVVHSLLLEPLPFPQPERLVMLWEADATDPSRTNIVAAPNYLDWQRGVKAFESTGIWEYLNFNFSGDGQAERVPGLRVSASTFTMLGVAPELGRTFRPEEDQPGHDVAIISHGLWQRRFGGRADIIGRTARINARPFEIIGVMPETFRFPNNTMGVWTPMAFNRGRPVTRLPLVPGRRAAAPRRHAHRREGGARHARPRAREAVPRRQRGGNGHAVADERARRRAVEAHAHRAQRRGRAGPADRLRQRRQPAARAGVVPPPGVRRAVGARRLAPQACRPGAQRGPRHCGGRRRRRDRRRLGRHQRHRGRAAEKHRVRAIPRCGGRDQARPVGAGFHRARCP